MKLIVLIGTDCHLELLPHFLEHYSHSGVDLFVCGLHGEHRDEARALLAGYPFEVVVDFGTQPYAEELTRQSQVDDRSGELACPLAEGPSGGPLLRRQAARPAGHLCSRRRLQQRGGGGAWRSWLTEQH